MLHFLSKAPFGYDIIQLNYVLQAGRSQPSVSTIMPAVLDGIINMTRRYIRFPYTVGEQADIKRNLQFAAMSDFLNVIGAIECTHIAIRAPSENEFVYVNRKNVHTIKLCVPQTWF